MEGEGPGRYLLDTSALLAHYRKEPGWRQVQNLFVGKAEIHLCSISITEFLRRMSALEAPVEMVRKTILEYIDLMSGIIDIDSVVSLRAFELTEAAPVRIPLADSLIASAALLSGACLVHRDHHFETLSPVLEQIILGAE
jgi:predicted nucleic acid-binding protein